jgi:hypothetical protein
LRGQASSLGLELVATDDDPTPIPRESLEFVGFVEECAGRLVADFSIRQPGEQSGRTTCGVLERSYEQPRINYSKTPPDAALLKNQAEYPLTTNRPALHLPPVSHSAK